MENKTTEEFRKMAYPDVVIWDTLLDLPKLRSMTPQGRMTWWRSLIEIGEAISRGKK